MSQIWNCRAQNLKDACEKADEDHKALEERCGHALESIRIALYDDTPELLTYPLIQPVLFEKVKHWLSERHTASSKLFREVAP